MHGTRKRFTHTALLKEVRACFEEERSANARGISTADCFMSGLAIFSLKYASLLQFEREKEEEPRLRNNLRTLYGIEKAPCDTYLRERLDGQELSMLYPAFSRLFSIMQRGKVLEEWKYLGYPQEDVLKPPPERKFLISLDGTGFFSSSEIKCAQCCEKTTHKGKENESTTYYHQMLVGSVVSPDSKQVLPIGFVPIIKEDGTQKNDCERNAAKRWLTLLRQEHPQLPAIIVADGLYSNGPFIEALGEARCSYILTAKEEDHGFLYEHFFAGKGEDIEEFTLDTKETHQRFRFMHHVPLNETHQDRIKVNVLYFEEQDKKKGKTRKWLWVTDIPITRENAKFIMKGGRARWKIENETFNTLKNQGYQFEHNFGHGYNGLSNIFAGLMLLAFFIDQILAAVNQEFKALLKKYKSFAYFFSKVRHKIFEYCISSFERLYEVMLHPPPHPPPEEDRWL